MNEPKEFVCDVAGCGKRFKKRWRLASHKQLHTEKSFRCEVEGCSAAYAWFQHLKRHMAKTHLHEPKEHQCTLDNCMASFDTAFALSQHVRRYHKKSTVDYWCVECNQKFDMEWKLKEHEGSHNKSEPFECETCHKKFMSYSNYKIHKRRAHKPTPKPVFRCEKCLKKFESEEALTVHSECHATVHVCGTCGLSLKTRNAKMKHEKIVHSENPPTYKCDVEGCNRSYVHEKNLRTHKRMVHEGAGFKCEICDRYLSTKQKLKLHLANHEAPPEPMPLQPRTTDVKATILRRIPNKEDVDVAIRRKRKPVRAHEHCDYVFGAKALLKSRNEI